MPERAFTVGAKGFSFRDSRTKNLYPSPRAKRAALKPPEFPTKDTKAHEKKRRIPFSPPYIQISPFVNFRASLILRQRRQISWEFFFNFVRLLRGNSPKQSAFKKPALPHAQFFPAPYRR
jgi:hypothetical protein